TAHDCVFALGILSGLDSRTTNSSNLESERVRRCFTSLCAILHWRFEPALDIENDPLLRSMFPYCPKQEVLRQAVKEALDVQI
ncbi:MAG TPA: hypothetical protein VNO32_46985, partial [Candidatus Acidoferrum sp.]|nr:hypothetical protein [Candidatus Acidoferrum sp.]